MKKSRYIYLFLIALLVFPCKKVIAGEINTPISREIASSVAEYVIEEKNKDELEAEMEQVAKVRNIEEVKYVDFLENLQNHQVETAFVLNSNGAYIKAEYTPTYFYFKTIDGEYYKTTNPNYDTFLKELLEDGVIVKNIDDIYMEEKFLLRETLEDEEVEAEDRGLFFMDDEIGLFFIIGTVIAGVILFLIFFSAEKKKRVYVGSGIKETSQTPPKTNVNTTGKTFKDIAGLKEAKKDVISLVDFIKNGEAYRNMGASLPKGVVLYGPPGTGKTLLAKAIAGEAGVPFFFASGSEFVEMYVGVGAKRVRELFDKARKNAPCIVFIDEIDAIAGKRSHQDNSEDRKTLNQLLTEMDGFKESGEVLVIAATNRIEDLDEAILRPGRFTDKFCIPLPETMEDRMEVIQIYTANKKFSEDVDFNRLAKETIGCSPADIEAIINESAIVAVQNGKLFIDNDCIEQAYNKKVLQGHIKENTERKKEELELVAWHEAGHTVAGLLLDEEISKVTILSSTSGAGGATFIIPKKMGLQSVEDLRNEVIRLYAGRCAEYLLYNDWAKTTTGASNDIERATNIIYNMVSTLGMTEKNGMVNLNSLKISNDIIADDVSKIAKELQEECLLLLEKNVELIKMIVEALLDKETIYESELIKIFEGYKNKDNEEVKEVEA